MLLTKEDRDKQRRKLADELARTIPIDSAAIYSAIIGLNFNRPLERPIILIAFAISQKFGVSFEDGLAVCREALNVGADYKYEIPA